MNKSKNCDNCGVSKDEFVKIQNGTLYKGLASHHIIPRNKGGSNKKENIVTLCEKCHREAHTVLGKLNRYEVNKEFTNALIQKMA